MKSIARLKWVKRFSDLFPLRLPPNQIYPTEKKNLFLMIFETIIFRMTIHNLNVSNTLFNTKLLQKLPDGSFSNIHREKLQAPIIQ